MKRHPLLLVLKLLAIAVFGAACSASCNPAIPDDPEQAVRLIHENGAAIQSAHFKGEYRLLDEDDLAVPNTGLFIEGDLKILASKTENRRMSVSTSLGGLTMTAETIILSDEFWARVNNGEWHQVPEPFDPTNGMDLSPSVFYTWTAPSISSG